jgi:hypothetical protein
MKRLKRADTGIDYVKLLAKHSETRGIHEYSDEVIREFGDEIQRSLGVSTQSNSRIAGLRAEALFGAVVASIAGVCLLKTEDEGDVSLLRIGQHGQNSRPNTIEPIDSGASPDEAVSSLPPSNSLEMTMKNDLGLEAVRAARIAISHEFDNDPGRLVAHYIQIQSQLQDRSMVSGPGEPSPTEAMPSVACTAQLGVATDEAPPRR